MTCDLLIHSVLFIALLLLLLLRSPPSALPQLFDIVDQGHITAHRLLLQMTYTEESPPRRIMSGIWRQV